MAQDFLHDKVAIVTGASSGIGRATALEIAKAGGHLVLAARRKNLLLELANEIEQIGRKALVESIDITQKRGVDQLISNTISYFGRIDVLVACAGVYYRSPISELSVSLMEKSMAVNFYGGLYAILSVLPHMRKQNSGHIVLVSTMDTKLGLPGDAPYAVSKAALSVFVEVLHQELHGTRVNTSIIMPGRVDTPFIEDLKLPKISNIISPQIVAKAIMKAIKKRRRLVILPLQVKILYLLKIFFPGLSDWIVRTFHLQGLELESFLDKSVEKSTKGKQLID
jgi:short-subunit dehydrogenase